MILYIEKYDIQADKLEAYYKWATENLQGQHAEPGVVQFMGYRVLVGSSRAAMTHEFADLAAWAVWNNDPETIKTRTELYSFALNVSTELWGSSPLMPAPMRPAK